MERPRTWRACLRWAVLWAVLVSPALTADRLGMNEPRPGWQQLSGAAVLAAAVAVARRRPLAAFALTAALGLAAAPALFTVSYGPALAVSALLLGLRAARVRPAAAVFGAVGCLGTVRITLFGVDPAPEWVVLTGTLLFGCVFPWLGGRYWRQSRQLTEAGWTRAARLEGEQRIAEERARLRERARIAQDMHDSLGHELSLIALRAGALQVAPDLPPHHRTAAAALRTAAADATERLHRIIGVLREENEPPSLTPPGETLEQLVARAAESGLAVRWEGGGCGVVARGVGLVRDGAVARGTDLMHDGTAAWGAGSVCGGVVARGAGLMCGGVVAPGAGLMCGGAVAPGVDPVCGGVVARGPGLMCGGAVDPGVDPVCGGVVARGAGLTHDCAVAPGTDLMRDGAVPRGTGPTREGTAALRTRPMRDGTAGQAPLWEPGGVAERVLYRVVREALTNAARHAPRAPVTVAAAREADGVAVTVTSGRGPAADGAEADGAAVDSAAINGAEVEAPAVDSAAIYGADVDAPAVDGAEGDDEAIRGPAADDAAVPDAAVPDGVGTSSGGTGLQALRVAVTAVGGDFEAGPHGDGFRVRAYVPEQAAPLTPPTNPTTPPITPPTDPTTPPTDPTALSAPAPHAPFTHARRRVALAFATAVGAGVVLVGGAFAWYAYTETHSVLPPAAYAELRLGVSVHDIADVLPDRTARDAPVERAPMPPPKGGDCRYYRASGELLVSVDHFRLCFDGERRLIAKDVIPRAGLSEDTSRSSTQAPSQHSSPHPSQRPSTDEEFPR